MPGFASHGVPQSDVTAQLCSKSCKHSACLWLTDSKYDGGEWPVWDREGMFKEHSME